MFTHPTATETCSGAVCSDLIVTLVTATFKWALEGAWMHETEVEAGSGSFHDPNTERCFNLRFTGMRAINMSGACISQDGVMLPLTQRPVDLQDFRDVFKRFDERWNLPRVSIHRVFSSVEGGERQTQVLAKTVEQKAKIKYLRG